jgi:DNA-binding NtrC family response regulator
MPNMVHILLHSTDPKLAPLLASALRPDCSVHLEQDSQKLLHPSHKSDVLLLDFDSNYSTLAQHLAIYDQVRDCPTPIIVMTDDLRRSTTTEFLLRGAFDCIRKPPSILELRVVIRRAHEHYLMKTELAAMRHNASAAHRCDQLVGCSGRAQVVYDRIRRVANLSASVLITGESGTGKELVARAIHNTGNRAGEPFIAVSCGAIPETLIESELFGHERGAYTGSSGTRVGYFEQAGNGTLFLDEIGELSPNVQVKLLRILQQREFSRLGSNKLIPLTARVLFATHRNLEEMTETGGFRKDLFYRVNVTNIKVPPLRDRTEDIPLLASHFLTKFATEYGKDVRDIRPNAMELLVEYSWPGNIRELENVIQGAVILADGDSLTPADLPEQIRQIEQESVITEFAPGSFDDLLRQFKINLANQAVVDCNGNKTLAARKLRVSRAYLHRLIRMPDKGGDVSSPSDDNGGIQYRQMA